MLQAFPEDRQTESILNPVSIRPTPGSLIVYHVAKHNQCRHSLVVFFIGYANNCDLFDELQIEHLSFNVQC